VIPYSRQNITRKDIEAVVEVLESDFLTQGPAVKDFEHAIASYCEVQHGVATCNATAALHLACLALGVDSDSLVWAPAISFVASANCARYCGAEVDFVDVCPDSGLIDAVTIGEKLERAKRLGLAIPDVLIVVHLAGQSCDMESIHKLCQPYGIKIIEDACHALGGSYQAAPIGNCSYSDCAVFSFHPVKPITSAEGGMFLTASEELAEKVRTLCSHGIVRDADRMHNHPKGGWYYEQQLLGFNYRLSDVHAVLGLSQTQRLQDIVQKKQHLASVYYSILGSDDVCLVPAVSPNSSGCAWHLFPVLFPTSESRDLAFKLLREQGFGVNIHYEPIPQQPYYAQLREYEAYPGADYYASHTLSLPLFAELDESVIQQVVDICCGAVADIGMSS